MTLAPPEDKFPMCLSPSNTKLKGLSGVGTHQRIKKPSPSGVEVNFDDLCDTELDSGWISDENLRGMEIDDALNQDIDWVAHDDLDCSLKMDFTDDSDVSDFAFGPNSCLSPLRGALAFEEACDVSSTFDSLNPDGNNSETNPKNAEKLLMSFDTMNFTIPSPTNSKNKKKLLNGVKNTDKSSISKIGSAMVKSLSSGKMKEEKKHSPNGGGHNKTLLTVSTTFIGENASCHTSTSLMKMTTPTGQIAKFSENRKKIGSYSPNARKLRIAKFHEKRKNRTWKKSIKYDCRKKLADDRPRIKGRFVRVLENATENKSETSPAVTITAVASVVTSGASIGERTIVTTTASVQQVSSPLAAANVVSASAPTPVVTVTAPAVAAAS